MSSGKGFSHIFIPSGEPEGLRSIEKSNWSGLGVIFPHASPPEARKREEIRRTDVYTLWGPSEESEMP
ncbi:MAG: hypothetical protein NZ960_06515 [Candidatus Kapabacteria bacterium]|nr:hypothetical protein [Candidatus Kapabacteria bacterium]MDW8012772.1 hypothetical protein [Bacteroidota bacterium]